MLEEAENRHASREERDVPDVGERDGNGAVSAENPHRGERTEDSHPERDAVRQRGDRDRHGGLAHHVTHSLWHRELHRGPSPRGQHHESVVNANS